MKNSSAKGVLDDAAREDMESYLRIDEQLNRDNKDGFSERIHSEYPNRGTIAPVRNRNTISRYRKQGGTSAGFATDHRDVHSNEAPVL
jgi:hypothetical protein